MKVFAAMSCFFICLQTSHALAGVCEVKTIRTACPGKEAESYKKCAGKAECESKKKAASADECKALAVKECENSRLDITKSKVINAKFDGKDLTDANGKANFCVENRPDFNKCN